MQSAVLASVVSVRDVPITLWTIHCYDLLVDYFRPMSTYVACCNKTGKCSTLCRNRLNWDPPERIFIGLNLRVVAMSFNLGLLLPSLERLCPLILKTSWHEINLSHSMSQRQIPKLCELLDSGKGSHPTGVCRCGRADPPDNVMSATSPTAACDGY